MSAGTNGWSFGPRPDNTGTFNYFISNFEDFRLEFEEVEYSDLYWREVMPAASINTGINPGADSWSYPILDWRGQGAWRGINGENIPTVSMVSGKNTVPILLGAVSGQLDTEEVRRVMMGVSLNLENEYPRIMRMACDRHVEGAFFYGDTNVGFVPFLDYPNIPVTTASGPLSGMTSAQAIEQLNTWLATVWTNTGLVHMPNTILMPASIYSYLMSTPRSDNSDTTILNYFLQNNITNGRINGEIRIIPLPYLDDAGVGNTTRMIFADIRPETMKMAFPLPFTLQAPQFRGFNIELFAEYKFGPVHIPRPLSFLYVDGV